VPLPENLGPPRQAEGAPAENGTPTDQFNLQRNFIRTPVKGCTGPSPVHFALRWAAAGHLVIRLEHGRNISHRLLLGSGWSGCIHSAERYVDPKADIHQQWIELLRRVQ
jgi:hypothetical protein